MAIPASRPLTPRALLPVRSTSAQSWAARYTRREPAPNRKPGEGAGPFKRMVIRGATMIDGTGSPAIGPVDIVIENDRIASIVSVGFPKVAIKESKRPAKGDYEIDAAGMYVLPGFINAHAHTATPGHGAVGEVPPGGIRLQAVAGARHHHGARGGLVQRHALDVE